MKTKLLSLAVKVLAFVLTIYVLHRLIFPTEIAPGTPEITPTPAPIEFGVGYNCEDFEYLSVEVNGQKEVLCDSRSGGAGASADFKNTAKASWYGGNFNGRKTSSGEIFDETKDTLACADEFKMGTRFEFSYQGKKAQGYCNDRGAFEELGRKFDLSRGLFEKLAPKERGVIQVDYAIIDYNDEQGSQKGVTTQ